MLNQTEPSPGPFPFLKLFILYDTFDGIYVEIFEEGSKIHGKATAVLNRSSVILRYALHSGAFLSHLLQLGWVSIDA